jgi:hypothetical protein
MLFNRQETKWCFACVWSCCLLLCQLEVDSRPEAFTEVEKVVPKLMTAIDDAHFKVWHQLTAHAGTTLVPLGHWLQGGHLCVHYTAVQLQLS